MKKVIITITTVFVVSITLAGGYQAAQWGMTPDEVKKAMPDKKWKSYPGNQIYYSDQLVGQEVKFYFMFDKDNKLKRVYLFFPCLAKLKPCEFPTMFLQLKKALTEKYGPPTACINQYGATSIERCVDEDGFFKFNNIATYLFANSPDYGEYWIVDDTKISLSARWLKPGMCPKMAAPCGAFAQSILKERGLEHWDSPLIYEPVKQETPAAPQENIQDKL